MKIANTQVAFREFPDMITLALNISNCPCRCKGCHSQYLADDIGEEVTKGVILRLLADNHGINCVGIMGGDADPHEVENLAKMILDISTEKNLGLSIGWYSGRDILPEGFDVSLFDFIKIGHYDKKRGGLDKMTTNQRMYLVRHDGFLEDITHKFWHKNFIE